MVRDGAEYWKCSQLLDILLLNVNALGDCNGSENWKDVPVFGIAPENWKCS